MGFAVQGCRSNVVQLSMRTAAAHLCCPQQPLPVQVHPPQQQLWSAEPHCQHALHPGRAAELLLGPRWPPAAPWP